MTYDDVSSTAETQRVPTASSEMDTAQPDGRRNFLGSAGGMGRKFALPALFFIAGAVVALIGERLVSGLFGGAETETRVQAFEDWRLVCPPAVPVAPPAPPAPPPPAAPAEGEAAPPPPPPPPPPVASEIPPCSLTIEVVNQGGSLVALTMNDANSRLVATVPHGVALEPGLGFAVGTEAMRIHPYETCTALGCVAHVPMDADTLTLMRESTGGQITVVPRNVQQPQPVNIPFSLNGFAEGHAALAREQSRRTSVWRFLSR